MTTMVPAVKPQRRNQARRRSPWEERLSATHAEHPVTMWGAGQFFAVLVDYDLLGRVYRDVLRVGYEPPSRRGQRSPLEWNEGTARIRSLAAERSGTATTRPFAAAFTELAAQLSLRAVSAKVALGKSQVQRLLSGQITPTQAEVEQIAEAFDKPPTYFVEYRVNLICATLAESLVSNPERSVDILVRMGVHPDAIAGDDD